MRSRLLRFLLLGSFASACLACAAEMPAGDGGDAADGPLGMVSTAHPIATRAGLEILEAGGNAFDAAVAVAATLNVVEPMMSGIGGYGTILVFDAETQSPFFLNSSDRIPRGVNSDLFRAPTPDYMENRRGAKAVSTPGNVRAWEAMSEEHGKLEWADLFAPAIRVAEGGFELDERAAALIGFAFDEFPEPARAFYGHDGKPLEAGDRLVQRDLAASLRLIAAQGADAIYGGSLGRAIDEAMREADGFLAMEDLEQTRAEWWEPIEIEYRGYRVLTASPPSTAFPSLVRLGLMSRFDAQELGHNTVQYLHHFAEVTKHAFWCRLAYAGDPEIEAPPLERLLSEAYWEEEAAKVDPERATPFEYPDVVVVATDPAAGNDETATTGGDLSGGLSTNQHTTHYVVADRWGNVVSATQTLGNSFGSRIMPEGTGIWLNNSLAYCTFEPAGNPMDAHAGRRKLSGDCPTFIMRDGRVWVALGTPGGHTIGQTVPQMVMNLIDFGMSLEEAIAAPRVAFIEPNQLAVEEAIPQEIRAQLEAMGHERRVGRGLGNAHALAIEYDDEGRPVRFSGVADPRGAGSG